MDTKYKKMLVLLCPTLHSKKGNSVTSSGVNNGRMVSAPFFTGVDSACQQGLLFMQRYDDTTARFHPSQKHFGYSSCCGVSKQLGNKNIWCWLFL